RIARQARADFWVENRDPKRVPPLVAASVGPYGAFLADGSEYTGHYNLDRAALRDFHRPRLQTLLAAQPDLLACETIPCLAEAQALADVLLECGDVSAWMSFSARNEREICSGESIRQVGAFLQNVPQVVALGVNCTAPQYIPTLLKELASVTDKPLVAYPNSGEEYDAVRKIWHGETCASDFAEQARIWVWAGARLIGGCCRTTPEHIAQIRKVVG
ncbi:MAG TPA: homocysteine S-methyltransferase, partial [Anaerolineales bacterium]|nr:homocysteine S-methyltransferase [Anaerolineales bacterium]